MNAKRQVAGVEVDLRHVIGGERVGSDRTFEVFSPIDGTPLGEMGAGGAREIDQAVRAARAAYPAWAALGPHGRGAILDRLAQGILERKDALSAVETADNGSLLIANQKRIVDRAAHNIAFFAE